MPVNGRPASVGVPRRRNTTGSRRRSSRSAASPWNVWYGAPERTNAKRCCTESVVHAEPRRLSRIPCVAIAAHTGQAPNAVHGAIEIRRTPLVAGIDTRAEPGLVTNSDRPGMPKSNRCNDRKLCSMSVDPTKSTNAAATSTTPKRGSHAAPAATLCRRRPELERVGQTNAGRRERRAHAHRQQRDEGRA